MTTDVQEINKKTKKGKLKVKHQEGENEKNLRENEKIVESNKKLKKNKKKDKSIASQNVEEESATEISANSGKKKGEKRQSERDESTSKKKKKLKKNKNKGDDNDQKIVEKDLDSAVGDIEDEDDENDEEKPKKEPSKRQLKREKHALREAEFKEAGKQQNASKALNYVSKWKYAKSEWKFNTVTQAWLIQNLLDENYVPDDQYATVLEYFENCKGSARKQLIGKAMAVIKKAEDCVGKDDDESEEIIETTEYKRARQLLQALPTET